ncbi:MAG: PQQ-binding-like beta-propeller repeat protein [Chloroflexi bacterium]|nr:PQQ-binding-like beta-propeller repeat protein [Chloroflexota bacterium]
METQPAISREEENRWVSQEQVRRRRRKLVRLIVTVGAVALVVGFVAYRITGLGPPPPSPSSTISSQSATGEWLMAQRDIQHTGVVPGLAFSPNGTTRWRFESQGPMRTSPVVADGRVYVATGDNRLVALDEATGDVLWAHPFSQRVTSSSLTIAHELVFIGTHDRMLRAIDTKTGEQRWSYTTGGHIFGSATVANGSVYFGSTDGHLYSLDARTGELLWSSRRRFSSRSVERIASSPTVNQEIVIVGSQDHNLYILDAASGSRRYLLHVGNPINNAITAVGDRAFFTSSGVVVAVDYTERNFPFQRTIWSVWQQLAIWGIASPPAHPPGVIWVRGVEGRVDGNLATAEGRIFVATGAGILSALDTETGEPLWVLEGLEPLRSSPIITGDTVVQAAADGSIYGFGAASGEQIWKVSVDEGIVASPVLANGSLYVPTIEGSLYALQ